MATNQMRRDAAKRKLVRQQARRAAQDRRRRQLTVVGSVVAVVVVVVAVVVLTSLHSGSSTDTAAGATATPAAAASSDAATPDAATPTAAASPTAAPVAAVPGTCTYAKSGTASKANQAPKDGKAATTGSPKVELATSAGPVGLTLEPAKAPCTVNSFLSLVSQKYFDATPCHRLTTTSGLKVLQCGDPTGQGSGGPGYTVPDENPTGLAAAATGTVTYPRGTVAMANTGSPNSGGSQFFLVYADSTLPPSYAVFGTIDAAGLSTLDKIAAVGQDDANGTGDGHPKTPVTITTAKAA